MGVKQFCMPRDAKWAMDKAQQAALKAVRCARTQPVPGASCTLSFDLLSRAAGEGWLFFHFPITSDQQVPLMSNCEANRPVS
jgi:hypothetical protein